MNRPPFPLAIDSTTRAAFVACPTKFWWNYMLSLVPNRPNAHLHFGQCFAKGLEAARRDFYLVSGDQYKALVAGTIALIAHWGEFPPEPDGPPSMQKKTLEACIACLVGYFQRWPFADDMAPLKVGNGIAVELAFSAPLPGLSHPDGGPLPYCGLPDAIVQNAEGLTYVRDEKTTGSLGAKWAEKWKLRCFAPDTELLTPSGWKAIGEMASGEIVMQWSADNGEFSWTLANDVHDTPKEKLDYWHIHGKRVDQLVTGNHRIPIYKRRGGFTTLVASELPQTDKCHRLPLAGRYRTRSRLPELNYIAALQADGRLEFSRGRVTSGRGHREHMPFPAADFCFVKRRKADRLRAMLDDLEVEYTETRVGPRRCFRISGFEEIQQTAAEYLTADKTYKWSLLEFIDNSFLEELAHWDGWRSPYGGIQYYTTNHDNAQFVQTAAHLLGRYASIHERSFTNPDWQTLYIVVISKNTDSTHLGSLSFDTLSSNDVPRCLSVETGFVLTRREGKISISGNSQFPGYVWLARQNGYQVHGVNIRGVAPMTFKVDLTECDLHPADWEIERWLWQVTRDVQRMLACYEQMQWDVDLSDSCASYGGCEYMMLCQAQDPYAWITPNFKTHEWKPWEGRQ